MDGCADERPGSANVYRRVHVQERGHQQGVVGYRAKWRVAAHCGDAEHLCMAVRENDGDDVVVAGVAIDNHAFHFFSFMPYSASLSSSPSWSRKSG